MVALSKRLFITLLLVVILLATIGGAQAANVHVANSKDWVDVYSVLLYSALEDDDRAFFLNSESQRTLLRVINADDTIYVYPSENAPFTPFLAEQLSSQGYEAYTRKAETN